MGDSLAETRAQRGQESFASQIKTWVPGQPIDVLFALAPGDAGVIRNGGRLGARWAPQALLSSFGKMALPASLSLLHSAVVTSQDAEENDFLLAQIKEQERLTQLLPHCQRLIHLGGGHDHILPLLRALGAQRPITVLNIDAHCDTRDEVQPHSGNPFRLFAQEAQHGFQLYQLGIHPFANSQTTLRPLPQGEMPILFRQDCDDLAQVMAYLTSILAKLPDQGVLVFSLDCDALKACDVGAVSAPNHHGLSLELVLGLIRWYQQWAREQGQRSYYGVYEFNPVYDTVSSSSARAMAGLLYQMIES